MAVVGATADLEVVDPARLPAAERDAQAPDAAWPRWKGEAGHGRGGCAHGRPGRATTGRPEASPDGAPPTTDAASANAPSQDIDA